MSKSTSEDIGGHAGFTTDGIRGQGYLPENFGYCFPGESLACGDDDLISELFKSANRVDHSASPLHPRLLSSQGLVSTLNFEPGV